MKQITRFLSVLFLVMLTVSMAAATSNDKLPTREEVSNLLENADGKTASDVMDMVKEQLPVANADLLKKGDNEAISIYWTNPDSSKGYGATYFKDGSTVSSSKLCGYTVKEMYLGKLEESEESEDSENQVDEENESENQSDNEIKILDKEDESSEDQVYTYDNLGEALKNYDGSVTCSSEKCATELSESLKSDGWETSVGTKTFKKYGTRYCVSVDTDDEGTVYVVLGI